MPDEAEPQIKIEGDDSVKAAPNNNDASGDGVVVSDATAQGDGVLVEKGDTPNSLKIKVEIPTATAPTTTDTKTEQTPDDISPKAIPAAAPAPDNTPKTDVAGENEEVDGENKEPDLNKPDANELVAGAPVETASKETPASNIPTKPTPVDTQAKGQTTEPAATPSSDIPAPTPKPIKPDNHENRINKKIETKPKLPGDQPISTPDASQTPKINPDAEQGAANDLSSNRAKDAKAKPEEKQGLTPTEKPTGGDTTEPEETPEEKKKRLAQEQANNKDEQRRQDKNQTKAGLNRTVGKPFSKIKSVRNRRQILTLKKEAKDLKKKMGDIDKEIKKIKKAHRREIIKATIAAFTGIGLVYGLFKALELIMSDTKGKIKKLEDNKKDLSKKYVKTELRIYNLQNVFQLEAQREQQQAEQAQMAEAL
ncbi:MAG: hypothetical protein US58_C0012G0006 [Candidatus Magasanikbacteria bacterium GW2011_GWA2_37_8]|uniref:Uncharacterized protein n=1 Tax=Candidatus Magasanikbacteria bacterium GW2011_GWA2_37_8 TaxID=1619036 RepID=A0A0G0HF10_9BACT|nr:MAG: hypothetical protein US58_C0012G0006 [Candidatus Magasanikbacteria bacterium GW2011_GWA2_37_8]